MKKFFSAVCYLQSFLLYNSKSFVSMDKYSWQDFLEHYSAKLIEHSSELWNPIPAEAFESKWLGFPPATDEEILRAEKRLNIDLSPSLRTFYLVTNGWRDTGLFIHNILPVHEIDWLKIRDPQLYQIADDAEKETGPFKHDPNNQRLHEYQKDQGTWVKRSLILNSEGDASWWLLDPKRLNQSNDWAGGSWASWNPGMEWTAESFAELMQAELTSFLDLMDGDR